MSPNVLTPKIIGREFIRRYYMILNQSPENLHCFYNDDAIFIHDDIDSLEQKTISVIGKQAISNVMKNRQSKYRHSCTIINGIDTVATINNGLVIQVYGDISHNNEHMRPFSQSFILAAASSIKYYVQNEIFRFSDYLSNAKRTLSDGCSASEIMAENRNEMNTTFISDTNVNESIELIDNCDDNNNATNETINELQSKNLKNILQETRKLKEIIHLIPSKTNVTSPMKCTTIVKKHNQQYPASKILSCAGTQIKQISDNTTKLFQDNCIITVGNVMNPNLIFKKDTIIGPLPNKIKIDNGTNTIADIVESAKSTCKIDSVPDIKPKTYADSLKLLREKVIQVTKNSSTSSTDSFNGVTKEKPIVRRSSLKKKTDRFSLPNDSSNSGPTTQGNGDLLQVFIGNISHNATETELRKMFSKFGKIARFRIHTNSIKDWLPHYAFVTYENMESVRNCLANKHLIYYPENSPESQKLNVNGDESIVVKPNEGKTNIMSSNVNSNNINKKRDLKQFHKNFHISSNEDAATATTTTTKPKPALANNDEIEHTKSRKFDMDRNSIGRSGLRRHSNKA